MAIIRPLRLKREVIRALPEKSTTDKPIARLWVDSGVFHLDQSFDYLVPDNLSADVEIGVRVQVPFNGRECEAIVLERVALSSGAKLKSISKVISSTRVASQSSLELIAQVASRWGAHPYDVIRSAIPPRVASVEKLAKESELTSITRGSSVREYIQLPAHRNPFEAIMKFVEGIEKNGSILVIVPDSKSINRLKTRISRALILGSDLSRGQRYQNFLEARNSLNQIVIGTRSAIFTDIPDLAAIVIYNESSEHLYEVRSPGWNARDVAILRARNEKVSLHFLGYSPSAEVARLIELGWISFRAARSKVNVRTFQQEFSELLPGRIIQELRSLVKKGPILFIAPRKGYSQAMSCSHCRNIALCQCGGRLEKRTAHGAISCSLCPEIYQQWVCRFCSGVTPFLLNRGSERFAQEIGKALPGSVVLISQGEETIEDFSISSGVVIATPGSAPMAHDGYAGVVILDGENLLNQSDLRAQERAREVFFNNIALLSSSGVALLVLSHSNPIVGALASWKPSLISRRELEEREEAALPPFVRAVSLDVDINESSTLIRALNKSRDEGRLPQATRILGPSPLANGLARVLLLAPLEDGEALVSLIHEFARRRSASRKKLATLRIDPYSLSR